MNPLTSDVPILVFDIETIPDLQTGKRLYPDINDLNDDDALQALIALRQKEANSDFMRLPLHKVACLSGLWVDRGQIKLFSQSLQHKSEAEILDTFLRACHKKATLVSWNGVAFDIPVMLYRMAHHKINALPLTANESNKHGYLYRYTDHHIDLIEKFAFGAWGNKQKLDVIAGLCGCAGKGDIDGAQVVPMVQAGQWDKLTNYCESDVLNTWFIYIRYLLLTAKINHEEAHRLTEMTKEYLHTLYDDEGQLRHQAFLSGLLD